MKLLTSIVLFLAILSCTPTMPVIEYKYLEVTSPANPAMLQLVPFTIEVVSDTNLTAFLEQNKKETGGVFFAMTPKEYEVLSANMQELRRYINETRAINQYYKQVLSADQRLNNVPQVIREGKDGSSN